MSDSEATKLTKAPSFHGFKGFRSYDSKYVAYILDEDFVYVSPDGVVKSALLWKLTNETDKNENLITMTDAYGHLIKDDGLPEQTESIVAVIVEPTKEYKVYLEMTFPAASAAAAFGNLWKENMVSTPAITEVQFPYDVHPDTHTVHAARLEDGTMHVQVYSGIV